MQMDPSTRIHELGQQFAKARRLFRRLHVDLDAGSPMTVAEACEQAGISYKDFLRTLAAMTPGEGTATTLEDWSEAPLADLVQHIQSRHHTYTRQELSRLGELLERVAAEHGNQHPELLQIRVHFRDLREDLMKHMDMEDNSLFPAILQKGGTEVFATLEDLHRMAFKEHEAAEELFQNIAILTRNFSLPLNAAPLVRSLYLGLRDLEEDLFIHIYLENHLLFPRSVQAGAS